MSGPHRVKKFSSVTRRDDRPRVSEQEAWDADNELSDEEGTFDPFDDFSSVLTALPNPQDPQPIFHFQVCRDSHPLYGAKVPHTLWEMCAVLAAAGTDFEWTEKFEKFVPIWENIQQQVKTYGFTHFSSEIPIAPVDLAFIRFPEDNRSFEIEQDPRGGVQDSSDIWALWRFIVELPVGEPKLFEVRLVDPDTCP
ncbi:unnamed protein product [Penicillium bialowiezense]